MLFWLLVLAAMVFAVMVAAHGWDLDSRNVRDAGSVLPWPGNGLLGSIVNPRIRLARLVALVCVAFVVQRGESSCSVDDVGQMRHKRQSY